MIDDKTVDEFLAKTREQIKKLDKLLEETGAFLDTQNVADPTPQERAQAQDLLQKLRAQAQNESAKRINELKSKMGIEDKPGSALHSGRRNPLNMV